LFSPGTYFVCGTTTYTFLLPGWKELCTKALLIPQIDIAPGNQFLPISLEVYMISKRAIQVIPLLIAMGITAGIGIGIGSISFVSLYLPKAVKRIF
jgi:hypothetical protein